MDYRKNLQSLSLLNIEKIYNLVLDIKEKIESSLSPTPNITIDLYTPNRFPLLNNEAYTQSNHQKFREDALNFLYVFKIITFYDCGGEQIILDLDYDKFEEFKSEIKKMHKEKSDFEPKTKILNGKIEEKIVYRITFSYNNEILLNNIILSKVNFNSENHKVFEYLYNNPNRKIAKNEFKEKAQHSVGKSFHKIVENLGFTGNLRKLFFSVSEQTILFKNPVTKVDLEKLRIPPLKIKKIV